LKKELFWFDVPSELVAQAPLPQRDASRLLIYAGSRKPVDPSLPGEPLRDELFCNLPRVLNGLFPHKKVLLIANDSRVYPARVRIRRKTGARGEVLLLETGEDKTHHKCLLRPTSKLKIDEILYADSETGVDDFNHLIPLFRVVSTDPPLVARDSSRASLQKILDEYGEMPLPPYIQRDPQKIEPQTGKMDKERYQTVYSQLVGSAAAPTAGLHFTESVISACAQAGISFAYVTLHVGLGTFLPVKAEQIEDHVIHTEHYIMPKQTYEKIEEYRAQGWPIIFVGTTSLRAVESFYRDFDQKSPSEITSFVDVFLPTQLYLYPQNEHYKIRPRVGEGILTNFHQPESSLAMLIAALTGYHAWKNMYDHAVAKKYRFFSYGDSSLILF
jgi:S-adenosylmethionine:tRNA ribosyltransferase-isomerase